MNNRIPLLGLLVLCGCLSQGRYESKYKDKFCAEWNACNDAIECDLAERDYGECAFDRDAAKECLDGQWVCNKSNSVLPTVEAPAACEKVYTDCISDTALGNVGGGPGTGEN